MKLGSPRGEGPSLFDAHREGVPPFSSLGAIGKTWVLANSKRVQNKGDCLGKLFMLVSFHFLKVFLMDYLKK